LDLCNEIRNRIAHHEPIWKLGPLMSETRARLHTKPAQVLPAPSNPKESLERLQLYYQRVTELMQWLSPALASAYRSGEVDARCRWLLAERTLDHYRRRQPIDNARIGDASPWLSPDQFSQACAALPLVSLDFCLLRPGDAGAAGPELLLGLRNNRPAQGWWFTPGGRIRKNELLTSASTRIALDELGLPATALPRARLMGAWDHGYPDSAFDPAVSTHYVNLPHWLALCADEAAALALPHGPDQQHTRWQWLPLEQAARDESVHPYVRIYAQWLRDNAQLDFE
jgi:colanic acid biosynthesis protein WcaH